MLTNNLKISDTSKKEFLEMISFQTYQKMSQKYCGADLKSVSDPLKC